MNATSLYVSTCRLVLQANAEDCASWTDLFRLLPYLRQSLSCTVCGNLLIEPYTPTETNCQHHVCKSCKGGKKKLKPSCSWCKDYDKYIENVQLRILLQCYKKLCEYITSTTIFKKLSNPSSPSNNTNNIHLLDGTNPSLISLIQEGAGFADEFRSSTSARPSNYVLPHVYTNTTSTQTSSASTSVLLNENSSELYLTALNGGVSIGLDTNKESPKPLQNGSSMYSVLHAGSGNKLTIKRKPSDVLHDCRDSVSKKVHSSIPSSTKSTQVKSHTTINTLPAPLKKQSRSGKTNLASSVKTGCRCGNATATPGKLTCCGQRCACYTESKPCVDCKCRGCRNPHTADGQKMWPVYSLAEETRRPHTVSLTTADMACTTASGGGGTLQVVGVYTTQLHNMGSGSVMLNTTVGNMSGMAEDDLGDIN